MDSNNTLSDSGKARPVVPFSGVGYYAGRAGEKTIQVGMPLAFTAQYPGWSVDLRPADESRASRIQQGTAQGLQAFVRPREAGASDAKMMGTIRSDEHGEGSVGKIAINSRPDRADQRRYVQRDATDPKVPGRLHIDDNGDGFVSVAAPKSAAAHDFGPGGRTLGGVSSTRIYKQAGGGSEGISADKLRADSYLELTPQQVVLLPRGSEVDGRTCNSLIRFANPFDKPEAARSPSRDPLPKPAPRAKPSPHLHASSNPFLLLGSVASLLRDALDPHAPARVGAGEHRDDHPAGRPALGDASMKAAVDVQAARASIVPSIPFSGLSSSHRPDTLEIGADPAPFKRFASTTGPLRAAALSAALSPGAPSAGAMPPSAQSMHARFPGAVLAGAGLPGAGLQDTRLPGARPTGPQPSAFRPFVPTDAVTPVRSSPLPRSAHSTTEASVSFEPFMRLHAARVTPAPRIHESTPWGLFGVTTAPIKGRRPLHAATGRWPHHPVHQPRPGLAEPVSAATPNARAAAVPRSAEPSSGTRLDTEVNQSVALHFPEGIPSGEAIDQRVMHALAQATASGQMTSSQAAALRPLLIRDVLAAAETARHASVAAPTYQSSWGQHTPDGSSQRHSIDADDSSPFGFEATYATVQSSAAGGRHVCTLSQARVSRGEGRVASVVVGTHVPTNVRYFARMTELVERMHAGTLTAEALRSYFADPANEAICKMVFAGRDLSGSITRDFSEYVRRTLQPRLYPTAFVNEIDGSYSAGFGTTRSLNGFDQLHALGITPQPGTALSKLMQEAKGWVVVNYTRAHRGNLDQQQLVDRYLSDRASLRNMLNAVRVLHAYGFEGGPLQRSTRL